MHPRLATDLAALPDLLEATRLRATEILDRLPDQPVVPPLRLPDPEPLPEEGAGLAGALAEFTEPFPPRLWVGSHGVIAGGVAGPET
ncbi:hypothetical protein F8568_044150 [Actinomadura sp. LD22]|uniref:Uncharacterized protein n=1 Tax=Actinomadura physcomitrii TaxID=2650748 RepID=A0A6I4MTC5_9ACTN|nr:hypothetical protein [Actinomadura physcomitrii]MWA07214.1 hypothetical protein [Actinomadura physcomitrii]